VIETAHTSATILLVLLGLFFTLVSTVGVVRLPDIYSRAHTASQADTLGAGFTLAGVALALGWSTTTAKTVLLLFFIFVTNPTAAHAISRAAHEEGIQPWSTDDDSTDRDLYESAQRRRGQERGPATGPTDGGTQPASDGNTRPASDGGTQPASDEDTRPASDEDTRPASNGNTQPASDGDTRPASDGGTQPASDEDTRPASDGGTQPASDGDSSPVHTGERREQ